MTNEELYDELRDYLSEKFNSEAVEYGLSPESKNGQIAFAYFTAEIYRDILAGMMLDDLEFDDAWVKTKREIFDFVLIKSIGIGMTIKVQ